MYNAEKVKKDNTYVDFNLLDENKKILNVYTSQSCFSTITYNSLDYIEKEIKGKVVYIDFFFKDEHTPYDGKFMKEYTECMNDLGFPMEYTGMAKDRHHILMDIRKMNDKRIILNSTLIIARYLYESGLFVIPAIIFNLIKEGTEPFIALQVAHNHYLRKELLSHSFYGTGNSNHALKSASSSTIITEKDCMTKEQFFDKVAKDNVTIKTDNSISVRDFWRLKVEGYY